MGFAMRVNFVDVICDDSLKNEYVNGKIQGYSFDVRLSYYRGHFLSDIDVLEVETDGKKVDPENITFCLNGKELSVWEVKEAYTEFWSLLTPAVIKVNQPGGLEKGKHEIKFTLMLRVPYLPLPGGDNDHSYMPLDSCGEKVLEVR
jgi:hypothetical protein